MSESGPIRTSVVVVGGGPVGLGLAAALGTAGIPTVLVERGHEPSAVPKGQNLTARSLEPINCAPRGCCRRSFRLAASPRTRAWPASTGTPRLVARRSATSTFSGRSGYRST
jgi:2-polyprenyl-6-methoxyphenol hydroxylase-like FAD-dependent oxidoreductase